MSTGLSLNSISKSFGPNRVLDDISLTVAPGEFVSLVGPSGCGKSTLLRIVAGLEQQDAGHVHIGEAPVDNLGPRARNIAMVFQNYALYPHMSAFENIALPLAVGRLSLLERLPMLKWLSPRRRKILKEIAAEVEAVASQLQISPLLQRKPGQLSGGQRQRVALARAMVRQPSLFLMDEPLSNLDAQLRVHMRDELADLHARLGATFVYVTHDQIEAMTMSSRVAMLDQGKLAQLGTPRELYERPASLAVARFIGSPAINILPGVIQSGGQVALLGMSLPIECRLPDGAKVTIGIRPESFSLQKPIAGYALDVRIRRVEYHGAERTLFADLKSAGTTPLIARVGGNEPWDGGLGAGSTAKLWFDPVHIHVFDAMGHRAVAEHAHAAKANSCDKVVLPMALS